MLQVEADKQTVEKYLQEQNSTLKIAASNTRRRTVVTGDLREVENFHLHLTDRKVGTTFLDAKHDLYSKQTESMTEAYKASLAGIKAPPQ